jgi:hypothetical protein
MRVHHTQNAEATAAAKATKAQHAAASKDAPKTTFAAALAKTSATSGTGGTGGSNSKPVTTEKEAVPKGETTKKVEDHPYDEIMSGPRNGLFINKTHNVRRGEAFALVHKDDRDLHVYGTGKDRRVIISWHKDQPAHKNDTTGDTGTTATPNVGVVNGTLK